MKMSGEKAIHRQELERGLLTQKISRLFLKYTIPGVAGLLFLGIQSVIDGVILGRFVGANALASVNLNLVSENRLSRFLKFRVINKYGLAQFYNTFKFKRKKIALCFIMTAETKASCFVDKNTIPVIIDFWLKEEELDKFYKVYEDVPLVLVTNKEVYDYLKEHDCPLHVEHWALSYPDQYALEAIQWDKKYEFCVFGRPNPFFLRMLEKYASLHPDFEYIINNGDINNRKYVTNTGRFIAKDTGRTSYLDMIKHTKISCYATPGIDEAKRETITFNQVTPRLFEMLCNGCMVIGHYPLSADTIWYNLSSVVPQVDKYEEFEKVLDEMRKNCFEYVKISDFMRKHYTSKRIVDLIAILKNYNIQY